MEELEPTPVLKPWSDRSKGEKTLNFVLLIMIVILIIAIWWAVNYA